MRKFQNIQIGNEVEFIGTDKKIDRGVVSEVTEKTFSVVVLKYNSFENEWNDFKMTWTKNGKKTSRFYNWGEVLRIVNTTI